MKKIICHFLVIVYVIVSVIVTLCLLSRNKYNVTQFGSNVFILVQDDKTGSYDKGDLIIVDDNKKYEVNDNVFYYIVKEKNYYINVGKLEKDNDGNLATIDGKLVNEDLIIGPTNDVMSFPFLGGMLSFLESKWGYLFALIFPVLFAFVYEIYSIIKELKK